MTGLQKTSLSLLISTLSFGLFAFWAYSGLFSVIETNFFRQKIEESITRQLSDTDSYFDTYVKTLTTDLGSFFQQDLMVGIFRINQSSLENQARADAIDKIRQKYTISWIRIFDSSAQLHDSTLISDIKEQTPNRKEFIPSSELKLSFPLEPLVNVDQPGASYFLDPQNNQLIFSFPIISQDRIRYGTAVVAVTTGYLSAINERWSRTSFGEEFQILDKSTLLVNMPPDEPAGLRQGLLDGLQRLHDERHYRVQGANGKTWLVYNKPSSQKAISLLFLVDVKELEFPFYMRIVLLVIVFLTVFLIAFLLLNLRQDDMIVLSDRIKRLQINMLKQYVENRSNLDSNRWHNELKLRREEVRLTIKKGLGRNHRNDSAVDDLIDKGWDEILEVLGSKKANVVAASMDISRLEDLVQKVISNYQNQMGQSGSLKASPSSAKQIKSTVAVNAPAEAQELDVIEEIGEAEELDEIEEVGEAEELGEVEEVSDAEELDEMEEVSDAEELDEIEAVAESEDPAQIEITATSVLAADTTELEVLEEIEEVSGNESAEELRTESTVRIGQSEDDLLPYYDGTIPAVIQYDLDSVEPKHLPKTAKELSQKKSDLPTAEVVAALPEEQVADLEELEELVELEDISEAISQSQKSPIPLAISIPVEVLDEEDDATPVSDLIDLSPESNLSFFQSLGQVPILGSGLGQNRLSRSDSRAAPIEVAKVLEELQLKCRNNVVLKSIYDYTGQPQNSDWNFQSLDSGVIQIPEEVYRKHPGKYRDKPLSSLVASIIHNSHLKESNSATSIGGLLRFDSSIESVSETEHHVAIGENPEHEAINQEQRAYYRSRHELAQSLVLTTQGLDFDSFFKYFRQDESGRIKAMYTFSKRFRAESAIIVRIEMGGLRVQRVLGLSGDCPPWLSYKNGGECLMELNNQASIALFTNSQTLLHLIDSPTADYRILSRVILVPVHFEGRLSYCMFGYSQELDMKTFLSSYIEKLPIENGE